MSKSSLREYDYFKDENEREDVTPEVVKKKWIRCKEGVEMYSMSRPTIMAIASDAGALYKINATVLINTETFENYMESFRVPAGVI